MKAELGLFGIALVVGGCASSVENGSVYSSGPTQYNNPTQPTPTPTQSSNTAQGSNIDFSGSQDFGFFRSEVNAGRVPPPNALDAAGFFAEHFNALPPPTCGERICLQQMLGVMGNLLNGGNCTMLELGLNSPLEANPGARPPLSLAVVVDVSGSMAGEKIQFVRDGLGLLIDGMQDIDQLALIKYSDTATTVAPLQPLSGHRVELRNASLALAAGGGTNLAAGLETGYREIQAHYDTTRQNRVILMSDGVPTSGITSTSSILDMS
ncbi:MAG TPA: VWA domain-containing protein, partial [Polyangiaceae bacterium]